MVQRSINSVVDTISSLLYFPFFVVKHVSLALVEVMTEIKMFSETILITLIFLGRKN